MMTGKELAELIAAGAWDNSDLRGWMRQAQQWLSDGLLPDADLVAVYAAVSDRLTYLQRQAPEPSVTGECNTSVDKQTYLTRNQLLRLNISL